MPNIKLFSADNQDDFVEGLNAEIVKGWVPQGSPFVFQHELNIMLIQVDPEDIIGIGGTA